MKQIALAIVICSVAIVSHAQEHLNFMDIPLDCPLDVFCNKLISNRGLVAAKMSEWEQYPDMETKKLVGVFHGIKNCTFYVRKHNRLNNVSSVIVEDTLTALSKEDTKRIISTHDNMFGAHKKDSTGWSVWYTWKTTSGEIEFDLTNKGFKASYTDTMELSVRKAISEEYKRERERQTVREICGIPFGSSYEKTAEVLENKYGTSSFLSDRNTIIYDNKSYAGMYFDKIMFLFQSDGYKSYLNGCVFILEATSLSDAKAKREHLYKKLSWKYDMRDGVDDNGNKYYYGGNSPVSFWDFGFSIDIIKYENRSSIPYAARLMYGRYNYVKEEFWLHMYPRDNIFNIYYNIGRRIPFQVKRSRSMNADFRHSKEGKTFMVERIEPRGQYGEAYGYCMIDNVRNDEYMKEVYPDNKGEIPCAGCGEWTLVDVPGADMNEIFPVHKAYETIPFGQHKGKTFAEVYKEDPKYIFWLMESDPYYKIDISALTGIAADDEYAEEKLRQEIDWVFPKVKVDDTITFGKYKGKTYKEVFAEDPQYIEWFVHNNNRLELDADSFRSLWIK